MTMPVADPITKPVRRPMKILQVFLEPDKRFRLKVKALRDGRKVSDIVRGLVDQYLEDQGEEGE